MQIPDRIVYASERIVEDYVVGACMLFCGVLICGIVIVCTAIWKVVTLPWNFKRFLIGPRKTWSGWFAWHPVRVVDRARGETWHWWEPVERCLDTYGYTTYYRLPQK